MLDAWPQLLAADPQLVMVLAPRHPERFAAVRRCLRSRAIRWTRRSDWNSRAGGCRFRPGEIVLLDTIGELASVYSLASVAFVGGSLVPAGGHNPLEPAQFGVPIVMGPHYANFVAITESLREHDALRIAAKEELAAALIELLRDRAAGGGDGCAGEGSLRAPGRRDGAVRGGDPRAAGQRERNGAQLMTRAARPLLWPLVPAYRLALALREIPVARGIEAGAPVALACGERWESFGGRARARRR